MAKKNAKTSARKPENSLRDVAAMAGIVEPPKAAADPVVTPTNDRIKQNWLTKFVNACQQSREGMKSAADALQVGTDLGYMPGGSNPITDLDTMASNLAGIDLTKLATLAALLGEIQSALNDGQGESRVALTEFASYGQANS